jgi:glycerol uptake facilitator-like aquaporin
MGSWLGTKRDVAIDSIVSYLVPRVVVVLAVAAVVSAAVVPPLCIAALAGFMCAAVRWTQKKKSPIFV